MMPEQDNYKIIDINNWKGKKHYLWFKNYPIPYYVVTSRINITNLYNYVKKNNLSFFISFMYLLTVALNNIEEMRLRIVNNQVILYDQIHPAYTVMTRDGIYDNCDNYMFNDFETFYKEANLAINKVKDGIDENKDYNDYSRLDQYYYTCLPWIDITSMTNPMPNDPTVSVPRLCWGKYIKNNNFCELSLSIQVHHALVDGYPLSKAFLEIQRLLDNLEEILN